MLYKIKIVNDNITNPKNLGSNDKEKFNTAKLADAKHEALPANKLSNTQRNFTEKKQTFSTAITIVYNVLEHSYSKTEAIYFACCVIFFLAIIFAILRTFFFN